MAYVPSGGYRESEESRQRRADNKTVDFFCKTTEDLTILELEYCEDFYKKKVQSSAASLMTLVWVVIAIIMFFVFFEKSYSWESGGLKLTALCLGIPSLVVYLICSLTC